MELQILNINYEQERKHKEHEANMKLLEYKKYLLEEEEKRNVEEHVLRKTKLNLEILNLRTFAE